MVQKFKVGDCVRYRDHLQDIIQQSFPDRAGLGIITALRPDGCEHLYDVTWFVSGLTIAAADFQLEKVDGPAE